jgi:hypothetical protein
MKKGVGSRVGSGFGSLSQRFRSGDPDQNVMDPQYWTVHIVKDCQIQYTRVPRTLFFATQHRIAITWKLK